MSDVQQEKTGLDPGLEEELKQRAAQQLAQSVTPGGTAAAEKTGTPPAAVQFQEPRSQEHRQPL